jgi:hypothetical protein
MRRRWSRKPEALSPPFVHSVADPPCAEGSWTSEPAARSRCPGRRSSKATLIRNAKVCVHPLLFNVISNMCRRPEDAGRMTSSARSSGQVARAMPLLLLFQRAKTRVKCCSLNKYRRKLYDKSDSGHGDAVRVANFIGLTYGHSRDSVVSRFVVYRSFQFSVFQCE